MYLRKGKIEGIENDVNDKKFKMELQNNRNLAMNIYMKAKEVGKCKSCIKCK